MSNLTSDCLVEPPVSETFIYIRACAFIIIILISLTGNAIVLFVIYRTVSMRTVTNLLICNSAVADLVITLYPTVWEVIDGFKFKGKWPLGSVMCVFMYMCVYLSVAATIITLMIITVDRYCAVMLPYKKYLLKKHLYFVVPAIWLCSFAFASPTIYIQKIVFYKGQGTSCVEIWPKPFDETESPKHYTLILFGFLYALPLCMMTVMYAVMARKLNNDTGVKKIEKGYLQTKVPSHEEKSLYAVRQDEQQTYHVQISDASKKKCATCKRKTKKQNLMWKKRRVIKMLISIVVVFAVCWLPVYCIQFLSFFNPYFSRCPESIPEWAFFLAFLMQYANSAINPLLYFGFSNSYRKGFQSTFSCIYKKKRGFNMNGTSQNTQKEGKSRKTETYSLRRSTYQQIERNMK